MMKIQYIAALGLCFLAQSAFAQTLAEKEQYAAEEKEIASILEYTNKTCKANITFKVDWTTFKKEDLAEGNPHVFCKEVFYATARVCEGSSMGLEAVQNNLKSVTCKKSATHGFSLNNGEFVYNIDYNTPDVREAVKTFLKENL